MEVYTWIRGGQSHINWKRTLRVDQGWAINDRKATWNGKATKNKLDEILTKILQVAVDHSLQVAHFSSMTHNHACRIHLRSIYRAYWRKVYKLRKQSDLLLGPPPLPERERKLSRVYLSWVEMSSTCIPQRSWNSNALHGNWLNHLRAGNGTAPHRFLHKWALDSMDPCLIQLLG